VSDLARLAARSASLRAITDVVLTAYSPRVFREKVLHKT